MKLKMDNVFCPGSAGGTRILPGLPSRETIKILPDPHERTENKLPSNTLSVGTVGPRISLDAVAPNRNIVKPPEKTKNKPTARIAPICIQPSKTETVQHKDSTTSWPTTATASATNGILINRTAQCLGRVSKPHILPTILSPIQSVLTTNFVSRTSDPRLELPERVSSYSRLTHYESDSDESRLSEVFKRVHLSGWYYSNLSSDQAKLKLKHTKVGTFLLRDSSVCDFLFTLSIKTGRGTTSIRIAYENGQFHLDCDDKVSGQMPRFECVIKLAQYYVKLAARKDNNNCVFLESSGRKDTPVLLTKPRLKSLPRLKHICRKSIFAHVPKDRFEEYSSATGLQSWVKDYLLAYPYEV